MVEHCCEGCETLYTCNILLIKISCSATLFYGDSMQVPILWHVRVYVHSKNTFICMQMRTYQVAT